MNHFGLSRRKLLAALASAGAASRLAPFVPASVRAAEPPKRLLVVFSPMGYLENSFWPKGTATDFTLGETMTALNPYKSKLLYLDGLMLYGAQWFFPDDDNEHGSGQAMVFTGSKKANFSTGPSVDQAVADHVYGQTPTKFRHLALGVNAPSPSGHSSCFYSKAQTPVNAQNDPSAAFDMVFKGFSPGGAPVLDTTAIERARKQKQSVIDLVKGDMDRICASAGSEDKQKCASHMDSIRMLESRLTQATGSTGAVTTGCTSVPAKPASGTLAAKVEAQMDVITAAFTCDLTRVASLQLGHCDGGLDEIPGINHHDTTHAVGDTKGAAGVVDNHKKIDRWYADRWAHLFAKMEAVKEGNGTMLDNTLILFGSDTTTGQSLEVGAHQHWRFPLWMAGGSNFAFKTGRLISLPHPNQMGSPAQSAQWVVHQRLLTSICKAFGMNVDTFGTNDPGKGPLTQLG
ncbi:MAG: DUF1552 domain-containing protein [Deltaproteobacteria bacterium]|nr:DUF1552 domain-containing protein [Deltaproteobacteria bacterium]